MAWSPLPAWVNADISGYVEWSPPYSDETSQARCWGAGSAGVPECSIGLAWLHLCLAPSVHDPAGRRHPKDRLPPSLIAQSPTSAPLVGIDRPRG